MPISAKAVERLASKSERLLHSGNWYSDGFWAFNMPPPPDIQIEFPEYAHAHEYLDKSAGKVWCGGAPLRPSGWRFYSRAAEQEFVLFEPGPMPIYDAFLTPLVGNTKSERLFAERLAAYEWRSSREFVVAVEDGEVLALLVAAWPRDLIVPEWEPPDWAITRRLVNGGRGGDELEGST